MSREKENGRLRDITFSVEWSAVVEFLLRNSNPLQGDIGSQKMCALFI